MIDRFDDAARAGVETHIRAAAGPAADLDRLLGELTDRSWPGGTADRSEPLARNWLRMWGPVKVIATVVGCTCASGRCPACN